MVPLTLDTSPAVAAIKEVCRLVDRLDPVPEALMERVRSLVVRKMQVVDILDDGDGKLITVPAAEMLAVLHELRDLAGRTCH